METGGALQGGGQAVQSAPQEGLVSLQELPQAPAGLGGALCRGPGAGYWSGSSSGSGLRPGGEERGRIQQLLCLIFTSKPTNTRAQNTGIYGRSMLSYSF